MARDYIGELQGNSGKLQKPGQSNSQGMFTGALSKAGLSNIPLLGGLLNDVAKVGEIGAEGLLAGGKQIAAKTGARPIQPSDVNPVFMSPDDAQQAATNSLDPNKGGVLQVPHALAEQGAKTGANGVLAAATLSGIPGLVKGIASAAPAAGKVLTGKGTWEGIVNAAENPPSWKNVKAFAQSEAANQPAPVRAALDNVLADELPNLARGGAKDAVEQRAAVGQSIPKNFWGQSNLDSAQTRAYAIYRNALSRELKLMNPDLGSADKIYGAHQALKSNFPKIAAAVGVPALGIPTVNWLAQLIKGSGGEANP